MNIEYKIIFSNKTNPLSESIIYSLEKLRLEANNIDISTFPIQETYYFSNLKSNTYLIFTTYLENELVAAYYIKNTYNSLYIDQLFFKKEYQNSTYHFGSNLLKYILNHKQLIEKYLNTSFTYSYLEPNNNTKNFYYSLGYQEKENLMRKHL